MSDKNLFSIGEIAKAVGVTRKIILNYEARGLISPDKKESTTANRYYTIDTFTQIRAIRMFQDMGLSLDEIREYFNDTCDLQPMIDRFVQMRDKLNLTIEKLQERNTRGTGEITKITIEPQTIYARTYNSTTVADKTNLLRNTALEALRQYGTDTTRRMYFTELSLSNEKSVRYCVSIPPESRGEYVEKIPALCALAIFHHGAYETIPETRKKLLDYASENGIKLSGTFRSLYIEGPPQHKDKSKFITQVIALIEWGE